MLTGSTSTSDIMGPSGPYFHLTNTMSQVSTPEFDFLFEIKERTEARIEKLSSRLEKAEAKVADLSDDPITNSQQRQLGRFEGLVATRSARLAELQADLAELEAFPLPEDEFSIGKFKTRTTSNGQDILTARISVTDSPYDDSYVGGDSLKVRVISVNGGVTQTSTIRTNASVEDGTLSFGLGSSRWAKITENSKGVFQILDSDNEVLFSQDFNNLV